MIQKRENIRPKIWGFLTDIFFVSVKNLSSGPRNHRQVPFNKRLKGYRTVPSASPFYLHALYSGVHTTKFYLSSFWEL